MKKKLIIVATMFIACTITINEITNNKDNNYKDENIPIIRKKEDLLSYFLENDNGEYEETTSSEWPTGDYKLNSTLSKCENGGELSWDNNSNIVLFSGDSKDKCYIYFDKVNINVIDAYVSDVFINTPYIHVEFDFEADTVKPYVSLNGGDYILATYKKDTSSSGEIYSYSFSACDTSTFNFKIYLEDSDGYVTSVFTLPTYTYSCFPAGTKIYTKNGYKNIEDIKTNDVVYSYNETTKKIELNQVTNTFIHEDFEIYNLYLDNEIIKVTPYHRFYVLRNNNYEWLAVKDLKLTDKLFDSNKQLININKIEYIKENNTVYNFEVANNHTYFVSEKNILVHNIKEPC